MFFIYRAFSAMLLLGLEDYPVVRTLTKKSDYRIQRNMSTPMVQAKDAVSTIYEVMNTNAPDQGSYTDLKLALPSDLFGIPEVYKRLLLHGVLYQCDTYFSSFSGSPGDPPDCRYPTKTVNKFQLGFTMAIFRCFGNISDAGDPPASLTPANLKSLQSLVSTLIQDLSANPPNQGILKKDISALVALTAPFGEPYSAVSGTIMGEYPFIFKPISGFDGFYFAGMMAGFAQYMLYMAAPVYADGPGGQPPGDFESAIRVYGDFASGLATADEDWESSSSADIQIVESIFNATYGFANVPDPSIRSDEDQRDWIHDTRLFLGSYTTTYPGIDSYMSPSDINWINAFITGSSGGIDFGLSAEDMDPKDINNWNCCEPAGSNLCDYYVMNYNSGNYQNLAQVTINIFHAYLKLYPKPQHHRRKIAL
jgi:hypothetical protein